MKSGSGGHCGLVAGERARDPARPESGIGNPLGSPLQWAGPKSGNTSLVRPGRFAGDSMTNGTAAMHQAGTMQRGDPNQRVRDPRAPGASFIARVRSLALTVLLIVVTLGVGWMAWSVVEWRHGRTASYRLTGLRVVRRSTGQPIGLGRSVVRNAFCCTLLLVPTIVACIFIAFAFVMGASPPAGLLRQPRLAPWDLLTDTQVFDERRPAPPGSQLRLAKWHQHVPVSVN
jgi:hypothetical protein